MEFFFWGGVNLWLPNLSTQRVTEHVRAGVASGCHGNDAAATGTELPVTIWVATICFVHHAQQKCLCLTKTVAYIMPLRHAVLA